MNSGPSIEMCYDLIIATLKANCPKDTTNLSRYGIRRTENGITIGGELYSYAQYTEEKNKSSKGWIKKTMDSLIPIIKSILQGNLTTEEIQQMINSQNEKFNRDVALRLEIQKTKLSKIRNQKGG